MFTETDECHSNPCQNGGTCVDGVYSFTCKCQSPYGGEFCHGKELFISYLVVVVAIVSIFYMTGAKEGSRK